MNRVIPYVPKMTYKPLRLVDVPTAWTGVESILADIIARFDVFPGTAIDFGVDYGYSTAAIANFFNWVIGVDTFMGDEHAGLRNDLYAQTAHTLKNFKNIALVKSDYKDYLPQFEVKADLIHVDIVHNYKETNELGYWATQHSDVVLFHDTISFPDVKRAVQDIAWETGRAFYEYQVDSGVGILVNE